MESAPDAALVKLTHLTAQHSTTSKNETLSWTTDVSSHDSTDSFKLTIGKKPGLRCKGEERAKTKRWNFGMHASSVGNT